MIARLYTHPTTNACLSQQQNTHRLANTCCLLIQLHVLQIAGAGRASDSPRMKWQRHGRCFRSNCSHDNSNNSGRTCLKPLCRALWVASYHHDTAPSSTLWLTWPVPSAFYLHSTISSFSRCSCWLRHGHPLQPHARQHGRHICHDLLVGPCKGHNGRARAAARGEGHAVRIISLV